MASPDHCSKGKVSKTPQRIIRLILIHTRTPVRVFLLQKKTPLTFVWGAYALRHKEKTKKGHQSNQSKHRTKRAPTHRTTPRKLAVIDRSNFSLVEYHTHIGVQLFGLSLEPQPPPETNHSPDETREKKKGTEREQYLFHCLAPFVIVCPSQTKNYSLFLFFATTILGIFWCILVTSS